MYLGDSAYTYTADSVHPKRFRLDLELDVTVLEAIHSLASDFNFQPVADVGDNCVALAQPGPAHIFSAASFSLEDITDLQLRSLSLLRPLTTTLNPTKTKARLSVHTY